jgi:AraC-like DNA-binding protein
MLKAILDHERCPEPRRRRTPSGLIPIRLREDSSRVVLGADGDDGAIKLGAAASHPPLVVVPTFDTTVVSCGMFVSSGHGTHPDRVLDNYELIVVRKGTLTILEDDVRYEVPPEHALLLHAGRRHRGVIPFSRDLSFYWIHFQPDSRAPRPHPVESGTALAVPKFSRVQRFDCVAELFHRYLDDQEARLLTPLSSTAVLFQILTEVARPPEKASTVRGSVLVARAEAFITRHLGDQLSTTPIARALRTSPEYLNRAFREVHDMTLTEYIHRRRLSEACTLLRETTDSVAEIAAACGLPNLGHFRRVFLRYRGVPPAAYRQLMARAHINAR